MRILFVASEAYPLIKTGGLADVAGALSRALTNLGEEVRLLLPGYADVLARCERLKPVAEFSDGHYAYRLLETTLPGTRVKTWLLDCPELYDRSGNPYHDKNGQPWADSAQRFGRFAKAAAEIAIGRAVPDWRADILHTHDWQAALAPVFLHHEARRPASVFTIHNLAYQGLFPYETLQELGLDASLWHMEALEFYDHLAFIKGGLVFADRITTVSPSYAKEIQTPRFGHGLDGLLRYRADAVSGILNGIDVSEWDPAHDEHLAQPYNRRSLAHKVDNKLALQRELGLSEDAEAPLLGFVGRLVHQKGIDLLSAALPPLFEHPLQVVVLGTGEPEQEHALRDLAAAYPGRISLNIGYDEGLAHRIEAGADLFVMPSRYEPCGLNQMYSQRYGTVPVVRRVGGLADTVTDASEQTLASGSATGFHILDETPEAVATGIERALTAYEDRPRWQQLQRAGMSRDFSWRVSAERYLELYRNMLTSR